MRAAVNQQLRRKEGPYDAKAAGSLHGAWNKRLIWPPATWLTDYTLELIREQTLEGFSFVCAATRRDDGLWDVAVDDEVAMKIATERLPTETDDDVVSRLVRAAIGKQPD